MSGTVEVWQCAVRVVMLCSGSRARPRLNGCLVSFRRAFSSCVPFSPSPLLWPLLFVCSSVVQTNISKTTFLFASKRFLGTFLPWWLPSWLKAKPQVEKPIVMFLFVELRSCSLNFPLFFFQKSEHLFFFTFHFSISLLSFLSDSAASLAPAQLSAGSSLTTRMTD